MDYLIIVMAAHGERSSCLSKKPGLIMTRGLITMTCGLVTPLKLTAKAPETW